MSGPTSIAWMDATLKQKVERLVEVARLCHSENDPCGPTCERCDAIHAVEVYCDLRVREFPK